MCYIDFNAQMKRELVKAVQCNSTNIKAADIILIFDKTIFIQGYNVTIL